MALSKFSKQKPYCRSCRVFLNLYEIDNMHVYICPRCDSKQVYLTELDRKISKRTIAAFEILGKESKTRSNIDCGLCGKDMRGVQLADSQIHLDICLYCQAIWFGGASQEYENFLLEEISLKPSIRELLKKDRVGDWQKNTSFNAQNYHQAYRPLSDTRVHVHGEDSRYFAQVSIWILLIIIAATLIVFERAELYHKWLYRPERFPWRLRYTNQIIRNLVCFFVQINWMHLISNCFFYYVFADTVERKLGTRRFLELLIYVQLVLSFIFYPLDGIGASAGIAALMAYYVMSDPYRPVYNIVSTPRLGRGVRHALNILTLSIPAWAYLIVFILKESIIGFNRMSLTGHAVGFVIGLFFYYGYPPPSSKTAESHEN